MKLVGCCLSSPLSQYAKALLPPWKGRDSEGEECGERTDGTRKEAAI